MTRTIRPGAALIAALLLALAWLSGTAVPASAGGPTSVIIVNPASGQAAALHRTNARYEQLGEAVGDYAAPTGPTAPPTAVSDCFECLIRLTWLIHDMQVWRIDRLYITPSNGIWIESVADETGGDDFERAGRWHRPHDATTLLALLTAEGVVSSAHTDQNSQQPVVVSPRPVANAAKLPPSAATGVSPVGSPVGVVATGAGVLGVAVGIVLGIAATRWVRRSRSEPDRIQSIG